MDAVASLSFLDFFFFSVGLFMISEFIFYMQSSFISHSFQFTVKKKKGKPKTQTTNTTQKYVEGGQAAQGSLEVFLLGCLSFEGNRMQQ